MNGCLQIKIVPFTQFRRTDSWGGVLGFLPGLDAGDGFKDFVAAAGGDGFVLLDWGNDKLQGCEGRLPVP